ncbi:MAG: T9SS type A sorting domain-containing protein [Candidatus Latescibacteria bacterium]|nr:T9SS type A sorting domain-containing protein [Candidatus Latescibacterota bacterium]
MNNVRNIGFMLTVLTYACPCPAQSYEIKLAGELGSDNHMLYELVWSHDGNTLAVTADSGIWIVPDGDSLPYILVMNNEDEELLHTSFIYDDSEILFTRSNSMDVDKPGRFFIESVNIKTGLRTMVQDNAIDGKWSRDGRYFFYFEEIMYGVWALKQYDKENGSRIVIISTEKLGGYWHYGVPYCISPDNSHVVINIREDSPNNPVNLYCIDFNDSNREPLTFFTDGYTGSPMYSPDGSWLLFTHTVLRPENEGFNKYNPELMVYSMETGECYSLFQNDGTFHGIEPAWAPDGKSIWYILLTQFKDTVQSKVYSMDFDPSDVMNPSGITSEQPQNSLYISNFPNPFNDKTTITFSFNYDEKPRLEVYNILGQKIRVFEQELAQTGNYSMTWDGTDDSGRKVVSGQYILKFNSGNNIVTHKMLYIQ